MCSLVKSADRIPQAVDRAMDAKSPPIDHVEPGVSIRMGPVQDMDIDQPPTNGVANGKRKSRGSLGNGPSYKEDSGSDSEKPLVRSLHVPRMVGSLSLSTPGGGVEGD